jgi:carbamoyl-phosphate synthase large subunit
LTRVNVLIASGGRRNYLVRWFREALGRNDVTGRIVVTDATPLAPALADADDAHVVPAFTDEAYTGALLGLVEHHQIDLAISLNDYELSLWGSTVGPLLTARGVDVVAPAHRCQAFVEDKAGYLDALAEVGILSPPTLSGSHAIDLSSLPWTSDAVLIKNRYGSGSGGLVRCRLDQWRDQLRLSAQVAVGPGGQRVASVGEGLRSVVVQPLLMGVELGLDVVNDFSQRFRGLLVREKVRMRSGETDQAVTKPGDRFEELARAISGVTQHRGLIDTDVILDDNGATWLIDINPRFGGGYPFSHVAGADIPSCYIAWHLGREAEPGWLSPTPEVASAKTEDIRVAAGWPTARTTQPLAPDE